ncbi:MAG: rod shape-determining protein MreC [Gemmatimonadetes bacterium]|nr:rod shape-determining protein MreC [Gemmatimonadota bacterium]
MEERALRETVSRLRSERDSLASLAVALREVAKENLRLRSLVGLAARAEPHFMPANLVPAGRVGRELHTFLLDVGRRHGVRPPVPVVTAGGLVGVVRSAGATRSAGDFWTQPDFRASAMTDDGRAYGIVRPASNPTEEHRSLLLTGVPFQLDLAPGTRVVTSGLGGVFPRGIPIGRVVGLARVEEGWAKSYWVQPAVHPGAAVEVLVMRASDTEVRGLWSAMADSAPDVAGPPDATAAPPEDGTGEDSAAH